MSRKQSSAFVTTRKGFCYLTVKVGRSNYNIMRIRNYTLEPQDEKREVCRAYRSKRQAPRSTERTSDPFVMVSYDPRTRTVYASDTCDSMALLDAVLHMERSRKK